MRTHPWLRIGIGALVGLHSAACRSYSYHLVQVGTITSRAPRGVAHTWVPAMLVVDDTTFSRRPCGHGTLFTLAPDVRVFHENGARADTGALTVGRRVSVFVTDGTILLQSCPPETDAAKVVVH